MHDTPAPPDLGAGQVLNLLGTVTLLGAAGAVWHGLGHPEPTAFWIAISIPVVHQTFVWLSWRLELRTGVTSRVIGFRGYLIVFFTLFVSRAVAVATLGWLDRGSLGLPVPLAATATAALAPPAAYALYSVARYFGMVRAAGADHFDSKYRSMPLVKKGIFRFTNNGMYVYAFLGFSAIATGFNSSAALTVAAFSHAAIWLHFHATEKPDMRYLYGGPD